MIGHTGIQSWLKAEKPILMILGFTIKKYLY